MPEEYPGMDSFYEEESEEESEEEEVPQLTEMGSKKRKLTNQVRMGQVYKGTTGNHKSHLFQATEISVKKKKSETTPLDKLLEANKAKNKAVKGPQNEAEIKAQAKKAKELEKKMMAKQEEESDDEEDESDEDFDMESESEDEDDEDDSEEEEDEDEDEEMEEKKSPAGKKGSQKQLNGKPGSTPGKPPKAEQPLTPSSEKKKDKKKNQQQNTPKQEKTTPGKENGKTPNNAKQDKTPGNKENKPKNEASAKKTPKKAMKGGIIVQVRRFRLA